MHGSIRPRYRCNRQAQRVSKTPGRRCRLTLESLEGRLAPAGIVNGDFAISNPADPGYGWITRGNAAIANGEGVLSEGTTVQTEFAQTFTIAPGTTALRFAITASNLVSNGKSNPPDAFEAALLDAKTLQPLIGPATGLSNTDSFLNIQQTGEVFYAPQVKVPGAGASGAVATLSFPEQITIDVSSVPANTQATLFFDLVGILPASSVVRIASVTALQGAVPPSVSFVLDPATDSGAIGDNLTKFNPVNLVGVTDPNLSVSLDTNGDGFNDGTVTADANGHFTFSGTHLVEGANPVRVQATNAQGSTIASRTITVDTQPPTGTLVNPPPGTTTSSDLGYVDVQWTDPGVAGINSATFGTGNVTITGVTVDQVQDLGNNLERYRYNLDGDTLHTGTVAVVLVGGQVADRAANFNAQATQSFTFQAAPVAGAQSITTAQDTAQAIALTGTDFNTPPLPLTFTVTTGPVHGTLSGTAPGLTYIPAAGYFGPDSLQFKVNNGLFDSKVATIAIAVVGQPIANPQTIKRPQDATIPIALTGSDPNSPPLPLTVTIAVNPLHGTLSGPLPNVVYTPNPGYFGPDLFQYRVTNGVATSTPTIVTLAIVGKPTAIPQSISTLVGNPASILLTAIDPNAPPLPLTLTITASPAHGSLAGTAPNLTYTAAAGYVGPDNFQFTAGNGVATSDPATISLTVAPRNPQLIANDDSYTTTEGRTLIVTAPGVLANDKSPTSMALMASLVSGPTHGSLHYLNADGSFQYVPDANFLGTDQFVYRAVAGASQSNAAVVHLTVTPNPAPPHILPDTPHFRYLQQRRDKNPSRFDRYHPIIGAFLQIETTGVPRTPTHLVAQNVHFDVQALRSFYAHNPEPFDLQQPILGALFQLESGKALPSRLVPDNSHFNAQRASYSQDPQRFAQRDPYLGAVFAIESKAKP